MRIQRSSQQGCVVLTLAGRLDLAAAPQLQRAILKQLAEQPPAIICDLDQVEAIDPLCSGVFTSIRHPALGWPATALVLCGTQPAVTDTLAQLGMGPHLAMYSSLDEALTNARARPERLRARLMLGPVSTAAAAGRAFVREVCDHWGLQELAEPAALLANDLVANAVVRAGTALELRVELRGPRLQVAVRDQDPSTGAAMAVVTDGADRGAAEAASAPGLDLMWTTLAPPALRAGLIRRARLQSLLQTGVQAKLCLLAAPAGSGKTTLLGQWRVAAGGSQVAWMSVGEGDNDPTRFWTAVVEALGTVEPSLGTAALAALGDPRLDLERVVLPLLLGELGAVDRPLVLVLDDYQLVTDASCVRTLGLFLEQLPTGVHLVLATRVDPPLPLARLRASGALAELRVAELQFTGQEASALLNGAMRLGLAAADVERLVERTEGSAAGLVLAGVALRGRSDPSAFIASFHGDDRHVAGFLVAELLEGQPEQLRRFLLGTSVLERLSGPLCDAVLETQGSAGRLRELERSNLLLEPLDDQRQWYRYQQLFAQLLRLELTYRDPRLVPTLHRRAAAWHRQAGTLEEASSHATAAGSPPTPARSARATG